MCINFGDRMVNHMTDKLNVGFAFAELFLQANTVIFILLFFVLLFLKDSRQMKFENDETGNKHQSVSVNLIIYIW